MPKSITMNRRPSTLPWLFATGILLAGCGGAARSGESSPLTKELAKTGLVNSLGGYILFGHYSTAITGYMGSVPPGDSVFTDGNLYYRIRRAGNVTTVTCYQDADATKAAGSIVLNETETGWTVVVNVTAGVRPAQGTLTYSHVNAAPTNFVLSGTLTTPNGPIADLPVTWEFQLESAGFTGGSLSGFIAATTAGQTATFDKIVSSHDSGKTYLSGKITIIPERVSAPVTITIDDPTGAATVTLSDGTKLVVNLDGSAVITYPDNSQVTIPNIFRGV